MQQLQDGGEAVWDQITTLLDRLERIKEADLGREKSKERSWKRNELNADICKMKVRRSRKPEGVDVERMA